MRILSKCLKLLLLPRRRTTSGASRITRPLPQHLIMPTPSRFKAPLILVLTFVLLFAGVTVLIGVFGLLVKLFGHA